MPAAPDPAKRLLDEMNVEERDAITEFLELSKDERGVPFDQHAAFLDSMALKVALSRRYNG